MTRKAVCIFPFQREIPERCSDDRYVEQGIRLKIGGDLEASRASFADAVRLNPENARAWSELAKVDSEKYDTARAIKEIGRAIDIDPNNINYLYERAMDVASLPDASNDMEQALKDLGKIRTLPHNEQLLQLDEAILRKNKSSTQILDLLDVLTKANPDLTALRNMKCSYLMAALRTSDAISYCSQLSNMIPFDPRSVLTLCTLTYEEDVCERATQMLPRSSDAFAARARAEVQRGDYNDGVKTADHAVDLNPRNCMAYLARSSGYLGEKIYGKAFEDADRAVSCNNKLGLAYLSRAMANFLKIVEEGNNEPKVRDDVIADLRSLRQSEMIPAQIYRFCGVMLVRINALPDAMECYRMALASDPSDAQTRASIEQVSKAMDLKRQGVVPH